MTAESVPSYESNDTVRKLRVVKAGKELSARAVPPVLEWGPSHLRTSESTLSDTSPAQDDIYRDFDDN